VHVVWEVRAVGVEVATEEGFVFEGCGEDFAGWEEVFVGGWADGHLCLFFMREPWEIWVFSFSVGSRDFDGRNAGVMLNGACKQDVCIQQRGGLRKHETALLMACFSSHTSDLGKESECVF